MEAIVVKPKNSAEQKALKAIFEAMNIEHETILSQDDLEDLGLLQIMMTEKDTETQPISELKKAMGWK
jgi:hypothetical protein